MSSATPRSALWYATPFLWLAGMLALAGLLAPLFWWTLSGVLDYPFSRFTNRALMVAALVTLIPYFIAHWRTLGLVWERGVSLRYLVAGYLLGLLAEVTVLTFHLANGTREWSDGGISFGTLLGALAAGAAVGLLEEILFRGVAQQALMRRLGAVAGLVLAALFFGIVHYVKVPPSFRPDPVTIVNGWQAIGLAFAPLAETSTWADLRLLNLTLVGVLLGIVFIRTGSLWMCIGLHAGFVTMLKLADKTTDAVREPAAYLAVAGDMTDSSVTLVTLLLLGAVLLTALPRRASDYA